MGEFRLNRIKNSRATENRRERGRARSKQSAQEVQELFRNTKAQGHALRISKRE